MILDRFEAVAFIGDDSLRGIYGGFNMLLRENLAMGGLEQWKMNEEERKACRCNSQVTNVECLKYTIVSSQDVRENDSGSKHSSPYHCDRELRSHITFPSILMADRSTSRPPPPRYTVHAGSTASYLNAFHSPR